MEFEQSPARFMLSIFVRGGAFLDDRNADPRRQFSHRRWKIEVLVFHHEPENAPADAAAEAMKCLALRIDVKRRRFFLMERTERLEIRAGPFQWKIRADHLDDVVTGGDLLYGFRWNHSSLFFARLLSEAMPNLLSAGALSK